MLVTAKISHWQQLSRRFSVFLFSVLGGASLVFLALFMYLYNEEIAEERSQASHSVSLLLKSSLELAMLKRDLEGLRSIINELGKQAEIEEVRILNLKGQVRFASRPESLGQEAMNIIRPFCGDCLPENLGANPITRFIQRPDGKEVLRTFNPVPNKPDCNICHGAVERNPINGILVVDYDAAPIRNKGKQSLLLLILAGLVVLFASALGAWWFMRKYVLTPISKLNHASQALSQGKLHTRIELSHHDEIGLLNQAFNHMAAEIEQSQYDLKQRQQFLQGLIDAIPDGVRVIDDKYQIVAANQTYCQQLGFKQPQELLHKNCYEVTYKANKPCPPSMRTCPLQALSKDNSSIKFVETQERRDNTSLPTEVYAALLIQEQTAPWVVESVRDLSKSVAISHEQKLSSLGQLAAGVAHEIHNPLASIRIALQASDTLLREDNPASEIDALQGYLKLVDEKVDQCLEVTRRLLKLGSLSDHQPEVVEVNSVIKETLSLLSFEREQLKIRQHLDLDPNNPRILANDSDFRMIIMNLAQNAFHAMSEGDELCIKTRSADKYLSIECQDTGVGIDPDILPHIFEPFFSHRRDGQGTGLGLTIVRSLLQQCLGHLDVKANLPTGTVFILRFPDADHNDEDILGQILAQQSENKDSL